MVYLNTLVVCICCTKKHVIKVRVKLLPSGSYQSTVHKPYIHMCENRSCLCGVKMEHKCNKAVWALRA